MEAEEKLERKVEATLVMKLVERPLNPGARESCKSLSFSTSASLQALFHK